MTQAKKPKKDEIVAEYEQAMGELTLDLQRTRADFENFRKRADVDKELARASGRASAILQLIPVIDTIERAVNYTPEELTSNPWVQGIAGLVKNLEKTLENLKVARIDAQPGTTFNPEVHEAIQFDEDATGEKEVVAEELQSGYMLDGKVIRHAMVKVTRQ